jgi:hypothetical protein
MFHLNLIFMKIFRLLFRTETTALLVSLHVVGNLPVRVDDEGAGLLGALL